MWSSWGQHTVVHSASAAGVADRCPRAKRLLMRVGWRGLPDGGQGADLEGGDREGIRSLRGEGQRGRRGSGLGLLAVRL